MLVVWGPQMPCDKIGKGKQGTSYVPGRTPTTAEPRFVKAQKSKAYSKGDCPASTHKSQRVPVGKPNSSRSSGVKVFCQVLIASTPLPGGVVWICRLHRYYAVVELNSNVSRACRAREHTSSVSRDLQE